jgi:hypothetical protein
MGRYVSADSTIQAPYNLKSFNRYSYVWNNPLTMFDPTGYNAYHDSYSGADYGGIDGSDPKGIGGVSYGAGTLESRTECGNSNETAPTANPGYFNFAGPWESSFYGQPPMPKQKTVLELTIVDIPGPVPERDPYEKEAWSYSSNLG